jgi:hypothetical protein
MSLLGKVTPTVNRIRFISRAISRRNESPYERYFAAERFAGSSSGLPAAIFAGIGPGNP